MEITITEYNGIPPPFCRCMSAPLLSTWGGYTCEIIKIQDDNCNTLMGDCFVSWVNPLYGYGRN